MLDIAALSVAERIVYRSPMEVRRAEGQRLPDFIIIGAAKAGTTTLHNWLSTQPEVFTSQPKEPRYFSHERYWSQGITWYSELFKGVVEGQLSGEASTSYTSPELAPLVASRIFEALPHVRLVYLVRHPIERLRSHYRHNVRRGLESLPLKDAVRQADNRYVGRSLYHTCLAPYIESFPKEQICVVRFEDLVSPASPAWSAVLRHLGLSDRQSPATAHNVTAEEPHVTPVLRWLRDSGLLDRLPSPPAVVKRVALPLLLLRPHTSGYSKRLREAEAAVPDDVAERIWREADLLEAWLGRDEPLWQR